MEVLRWCLSGFDCIDCIDSFRRRVEALVLKADLLAVLWPTMPRLLTLSGLKSSECVWSSW